MKKASKALPLLFRTVLTIGKRCREFMDSLQAPEAAGLHTMGVHLMGCSALRPPYVVCRPLSRFGSLLLPVEGELRLTLPNRVTSIRPGEVWVIPAQSFCRYELPRGTSRMSWFHFDPGAIPSHLHSGAVTRIACESPINARLLFYMEALREEGGRAEARSRQIRHGLYELVRLELERLLFSRVSDGARQTLDRLDAVWEQVERDTCGGWDVPTLARKANLSPSRFHAVSLQQFGMTPHEKLTQIRINQAIARLLATDDKLEVIARATGYSSAFAFSKAFKKAVGTSPRRFRESRIGGALPAPSVPKTTGYGYTAKSNSENP